VSHVYHDALPGFDPGNIWHDGCPECEDRAADPLDGLSSLGYRNARQAWADMLAAKWSSGEGLSRNVSVCDTRLLNALYAIAVFLERATGGNPHDVLSAIDVRNAELEDTLGRWRS
jgi:hypothetical protein